MGKSKHRGARVLGDRHDAKRSAKADKKKRYHQASRLANASEANKDRAQGKVLRKNLRGEIAMYVSRARALKMLQVSLRDFRRLCILKNVYPREPNRAIKSSSSKVFYHRVDIANLCKEPLLEGFRETKVFMKRVKRHLGKDDQISATLAYSRRPSESLSHLIKERYPTFEIALKDLSDCLSLMAMFSTMPSVVSSINAAVVAECSKLCGEFISFCVSTKSIKYIFVSVKGIYYSAVVEGISVTWLVPHSFSAEVPDDVDFNVMGTFLSFYRTLLAFVNHKLYTSAGQSYPPSLVAVEVSPGMVCDGEVSIATDLSSQGEMFFENLFKDMRFFVSREVPSMCACVGVLSRGGSIVSAISDATHVITDRPNITTIAGIEYIQPQWIFDCMNFNKLLPTKRYVYDTRDLPPHLSPFVDAVAEGHTPDYAKQVLKLKRAYGGVGAGEEVVEDVEEEDAEEHVEEEDAEEDVEEEEAEEGVEEEDAEEEIAQPDSSSDSDAPAPTVRREQRAAGAFIASDSFDGERAGYGYKLGKQGKGYYKLTNKRVAFVPSVKSVAPRKAAFEDRQRRAASLPRKKKKLYDKMEQRQQKREKKTERLSTRSSRKGKK